MGSGSSTWSNKSGHTFIGTTSSHRHYNEHGNLVANKSGGKHTYQRDKTRKSISKASGVPLKGRPKGF